MDRKSQQADNFIKYCLQVLLAIKRENVMKFIPSANRELAINYFNWKEEYTQLRKLKDHEIIQQCFPYFPVPKLIGKNIENFPLQLSLSVYNFANQDAVNLLVHIFYVYFFSADELNRHYSDVYEFNDPNLGKMRMSSYLLLSITCSRILQTRLNNLVGFIDDIKMIGNLDTGTITYTVRNAGTTTNNKYVWMQFFISHKLVSSRIVESTIEYGFRDPFFDRLGEEFFSNFIID